MLDGSDSEDTDAVAELEEIHKYVEEQKALGNDMFVSGWDDERISTFDTKEPIEDESKRILWAAENGHLDVVKEITLQNPELLSSKDDDGYTPLHRACYNNHLEVVELLIESGADITATTNDLWTPLHSACLWNNAHCAIRLIEAGADVNATTNGGQTPLHLSAQFGQSSETLEMLLNHPLVDSMRKNNAGDTAYDVSKRNGVFHVLFEIVDHSVNLIPDNR